MTCSIQSSRAAIAAMAFAFTAAVGCGNSAGNGDGGDGGSAPMTGGTGAVGGSAGMTIGGASGSAGVTTGGSAGASTGGAGGAGDGGTSATGATGGTSAAGGASAAGGSAGETNGGSGGSAAGSGGVAGSGSGAHPTGRWESVEVPFTGRVPNIKAVKLEDGSVLLLGWASQVFRFVPTDNTVETLNPPPDARANAATSLLADGRVLVAGGNSSAARDGLETAFIYDPMDDVWTPTTSLPAPRAQQAALTLANGDVLVAGGVGPGVGGTPVAEMYRFVVDEERWETLEPLTQPVRFPSLFALNADTLLVMSETPQVYSIESESVTASPILTQVRRYAVATQLAGLEVVAVGGSPVAEVGDDDLPFATVDRYALGSAAWTSLAPLSSPRSEPGIVTLADGTILVGGGTGSFASGADPTETTAERYVPSEDAWYEEAPPPIETGTPAVLLDDGSVFFVNGARFYPEPWQ